MIRLSDNLWIGIAPDEERADLHAMNIGAILNVAQDLQGTRGWTHHQIEYMQVGLIDGPGNPPAGYYAAVFALATLLKRTNVMVCCHGGGRSLSVAMMYMNLRGGRTWDELLALLRERVDNELPLPNKVHRSAFDKLDWASVAKLLDKLEK